MQGRCPKDVFPTLLAMSLGAFCLGYWFFGRIKRALADNV